MRAFIRIWVVIVAAALTIAAGVNAQRADSPDVMLRQAADKAAVDGDLAAAIALYKTVVDRFQKTNPAAAATALLGIADSYQKLGDRQATATLEKLIKEFAGQSAQVAEARRKLASLAAAAGNGL